MQDFFTLTINTLITVLNLSINIGTCFNRGEHTKLNYSKNVYVKKDINKFNYAK